jgi:hypothetical protein
MRHQNCVACCSSATKKTGNEQAYIVVCGQIEEGIEWECLECGCVWTE